MSPVDHLTKSINELVMSQDLPYPEHWKLNPDEPGALVDRLPGDMVKYEVEYTKAGVPCHRVVKDEHGTLKLQPRMRCHPDADWFKHLKHEIDVEFVVLSRPVPPDQLEKASGDRHILRGMDGTGVEYMVILEKDIAAHEAKGWKVWYPEPPSFTFDEGVYKDKRKLRNKPADVAVADKPALDTSRFLEIGNDFVRRHRTKGSWKPGDLIGPNGSDNETKAKSPSYAAPEDWNKLTEHRSATSGGHLFHYDRPDNVCLGWGGYDEYTEWQSNGRAISKEMVEETVEWSTDLMRPLEIESVDGNLIETIIPNLEEKFIPPRPQKPISLYEAVNEDKTKKLQRHAQSNSRAAGQQDQKQATKTEKSWFRPE
ncbi:hypothetical protein HJFPF1_03747 [Paramyrothecium foliicola]|nr:hypothetical protein HJFPF1_03747 [Paramyrothecium foliicola]